MAGFSDDTSVGTHESSMLFFLYFSLSFIFMLRNTEYWLFFQEIFIIGFLNIKCARKKRKKRECFLIRFSL